MLFHGLDFEISPLVAEPYIHTETLVDLALDLIKDSPTPRICDIGCGSGNIVVSILAARPDATAIAVDISGDAVDLTVVNAVKHFVKDRVWVERANLLNTFDVEKFDLIIANLPYLSLERSKGYTLPATVTDGRDGLSLIRKVLYQAPARLKPGGYLILEYSEAFVDKVVAMFDESIWHEIEVMYLFENSPIGIKAEKIGEIQ